AAARSVPPDNGTKLAKARKSSRRGRAPSKGLIIGLAAVLIGVVVFVAQTRPRIHDEPRGGRHSSRPSESFRETGDASDTVFSGTRPTTLAIDNDWDRFRLRAESEYLRIVKAGDAAAINRLTSRTLRGSLEEIGIAREQIDERPGAALAAGAGHAPVQWRIAVSPRTSLYRINDAISQAMRALGGHVIRGAERPAPIAGISLDLRVGYGDRVTHAIVVEPNPTMSDAGARIAFIVTDLEDADPELLAAFSKSPVPFAGAFRHDRPAGIKLAKAWREKRREVFALLPMEPRGYPQNDPGKDAILLDLSRIEVEDRIQRCLSALAPVAGVVTRMGSAAVNDPDVMKSVLTELRRRDLPFLDAHGPGPSVVEEMGEHLGARTATTAGSLDGSTAASVKAKLPAIVERAVQSGTLIITIRANGAVLTALEAERAALTARGVEFVPASSLIL
ncbi:MAG TPA: divergent polysaccharide deacetylase family protein, partial [Candidatus Eisenbacteria bacterium]|nr:divergent polysaccharide deacetylase family protein [Candidatus Eisenbacteria bacterium]